MSETIWRATDKDGRCFQYLGEKPSWDGREFNTSPEDNALVRYHGSEKPPPGECWEYRLTRKGEQPSGEAWERLVESCRVYCLEITPDNLQGKDLQEAFSAYEAQSADEPPESQKQYMQACEDDLAKLETAVEVLTQERDESRAEAEKVNREFDDYLESLARFAGCNMEKFALPASHGNHRLRRACLIQEKLCLSSELADERASGGQVIAEQINVIAELQAKLAKPEMPECVRELLEWAKSEDLNEPAKQIAAVEAHYAPPFRIDKLGVYATENGNPWEVIYIDPKGGVVARHKTTKLLENFHMSGACKGGQFSLTKYLRPLEG